MLPSRYTIADGQSLAGGYGAVQVAYDSYLGRNVIFKVMQSAENNDQLINEIKHLSNARSRHIVEIYDVLYDTSGIAQGIIIEHLTGRDYLTFHNEASSDPLGLIRVLYQIATALSDLHKLGITHRDLKLENFKDSASGILKIFDFGLSVFGEDYRTKANRGTLAYAAPELFRCNAEINPTLDIYAFGVCAWALSSNKLPEELMEIPPQSSGSPMPSIASITPLPGDVTAAIDSCLNIDPCARPSAEMLSSLFAKHLVRGQHKGLFVSGKQDLYELSNHKNNVNVKIGSLGEIKVVYDGLDFVVAGFSGHVCVNNLPIANGQKLPEACVLTFGAPELQYRREWVTFSSSKPEVVL